MDAFTNILHQVISWLGYIVMFAFVAFTMLAGLYYIGLFLFRLIRRLFVRSG